RLISVMVDFPSPVERHMISIGVWLLPPALEPASPWLMPPLWPALPDWLGPPLCVELPPELVPLDVPPLDDMPAWGTAPPPPAPGLLLSFPLQPSSTPSASVQRLRPSISRDGRPRQL